MARALQHLGGRDRLAAAYRVRQREHALVGVVQRGGGIGRRAWLCKRTTFTPRQTSIGSLFAQWLSGSWTVRSASGALACAHARRSVPHATVRAWDYDNAAHGTTASGRTGGGMPCGGWNRHSVGAYEPKGRSRRTAGAPGAHPRRSTARGRRALGARSAPHRMRMRRQPWIPRGAPRTPCESVGPAATPAGLATAARAAAQRRRSDRGWTHAAAGCAAAVARGGQDRCGTTSRADSMVASASRCSCRRKRRSPPTRSRTSVAGDSAHRPHAWMPCCGIPWRVK